MTSVDERVAHIDQLAFVRESIVQGGAAHGCRAIDVLPCDGVHFRILPDRGLDLGHVSYRGVSMSWTSRVGETGPRDVRAGDGWLDAFGGGLLTTCGLRNVGAASEGHGLHGEYSHRPAHDVTVARRELDDGAVEVEVRGVVEEASSIDHHLVLERTLRTRSASGAIEVVDVTTNAGRTAEPAPILYHVNFGFPFLDAATTVDVPAVRTLPRDRDAEAIGDGWSHPGPPDSALPPIVVEHVVDTAADGRARARVHNPDLGLELELSWASATLPRLHQWLHLAPNVYVVALEPANCSVMGRAFDRAEGRLPSLAPGESRLTTLRLEARDVRHPPGDAATTTPTDARRR